MTPLVHSDLKEMRSLSTLLEQVCIKLDAAIDVDDKAELTKESIELEDLLSVLTAFDASMFDILPNRIAAIRNGLLNIKNEVIHS